MHYKKHIIAVLIFIIAAQVTAIFYFNLDRYLIPRSSINKMIKSFRGCGGYPRGSDLCKAIQESSNPDAFTVHGNLVYSKPYASDTNWAKYDSKTGEIVEICGFWIKGCHTPEELKTFKPFN